jgi:hypothetical protein
LATRDRPVKLTLVHGTWGRGFSPKSEIAHEIKDDQAAAFWFQAGSKFRASLSAALDRPADYVAFLWSGANSVGERAIASARLAKTLDETVAAEPGSRHFIIAHSHGGNVALDALPLLTGSARNLHIITLATPFLTIYEERPGIFDKLFVISLAIALATLVGYEWYALGGSPIFPATNNSILALSLLFGVITFWRDAYRRLRKKETSAGKYYRALSVVKSINYRSLVTAGALFVFSWISFGPETAAIVFFVVFPSLNVMFTFMSLLPHFLYATNYKAPPAQQDIAHLKILRSKRDEASLALLAGKVGSFLSNVTGAISIVVPMMAGLFALVLLYVAVAYLAAWPSHQQCAADAFNCSSVELNTLSFGVGTIDIVDNIARYVSVGSCICLLFVFLTAAFKSLFGKELLIRSSNVTVNAFDVPYGSQFYTVDWCATNKEAVFGLRHSLYNNPYAVAKIAAHIEAVCAADDYHEMPVAGLQLIKSKRKTRLLSIAGVAIAACAYAIAVMASYAPPGAQTTWCALNSYFEKPAPNIGLKILLTRLQDDKNGMGDSLAKSITNQYGFPVMRTCVQIIPGAAAGSAANSLQSSYHASLVLWGRVASGGQIELQAGDDTHSFTGTPDSVTTQLHASLDNAIYLSGVPTLSAAALAAYADQVDAFVQHSTWSDDLSAGLRPVQDNIEIHVTAGRLELFAGVAAQDGQRIKKALSYFADASSTLNQFPDVDDIDWTSDLESALTADAQLNGSADSASQVASMYLKAYQNLEQDIGAEPQSLQRDANQAAQAYSQLYSITHQAEAESNAIRLACESVVWVAYTQQEAQIIAQKNASLPEGQTPAIMRPMLPVEQTQGYKILVGANKDPGSIVKRGLTMKPADCQNF